MTISPSLTPPVLSVATWDDYLALRDNPQVDWRKISFHDGWLWCDMGKEGINHASYSDLLTAIFFVWAFLHPDQVFSSLGRCLIEKPGTQACTPDLVLYRGEDFPRWQPGEPRRIDLNRHRLPDLVGEIADTSLSQDLDEQKHLYASLGIPEYWVIDVRGNQVFAFVLSASGSYELSDTSQVLTGLNLALIEQAIAQLATQSNTAAAAWFLQQLQA